MGATEKLGKHAASKQPSTSNNRTLINVGRCWAFLMPFQYEWCPPCGGGPSVLENETNMRAPTFHTYIEIVYIHVYIYIYTYIYIYRTTSHAWYAWRFSSICCPRRKTNNVNNMLKTKLYQNRSARTSRTVEASHASTTAGFGKQHPWLLFALPV